MRSQRENCSTNREHLHVETITWAWSNTQCPFIIEKKVSAFVITVLVSFFLRIIKISIIVHVTTITTIVAISPAQKRFLASECLTWSISIGSIRNIHAWKTVWVLNCYTDWTIRNNASKQQHLDAKISPSAHRNLCGGKTKQRNIKSKGKQMIDEQLTSNKIYLAQAK